MARWLICEGTKVVNVVGGTDEPIPATGQFVMLDASNVVNVGATVDPKDAVYSKMDAVILTMIFQIVKGTVPGGMPQPGLTAAQFKAYVKNQMT